MPTSSAAKKDDEKKRRYDKGERRFKHVGKGAHPVIEFDDSEPRKWIGKCPSTLSEADRTTLLNEAIGAPNGDRELSVPKRLYVVHEGAIYEAKRATEVAPIMDTHIRVSWRPIF